MKKLLTLTCIFCMTIFMNEAKAQTCDTVSNVGAIGPGGAVIYIVPPPGFGYLAGHNSYDDISKVDFFTNSAPNAEVTGAFYFFGIAKFANANSSITAAVWDNSGSGGSPGTMIASETVLISNIATDVANTLPTYVQFDPPATVSGNYYVGITFTYAAGDTVALFTDTIGSNTPTAWEQWSDSTWTAYTSSWGSAVDIAHLILPIICSSLPPCNLSATASATDVSVIGGNDGTATATPIGGTAPYSYSWSNGGTTQTITGLTADFYSVTVSDQSGCTTSALTTVGSPPSNCDTISNVSTIGPGGFVIYIDNFSGGGGYISGHNGYGDVSKADYFANTSSVEVTSAYYFFGVAQFGSPGSTITAAVWDNTGTGGSPGAIIASETLLISDIAQDVANGLPTVVPFNPPAITSGDFYVGITFGYGTGDTVALFTDTIGSGTPTGWEEWDPNTGGGWYAYADSFSYGIDIAHVIVPVVCPSSCPTITVSTTTTNSICTNSNGTAAASASGGTGPYTYSWSNGQTGATATGLSAGITYSVTATDANNCNGVGSATITATVTALNVSVSTTDNTACTPPGNGTANAAVTGGTMPYNFTWSNSASTQSISALSAGTYSVIVYDANGCSGNGSGAVGDNPPAVTVTTSSTPNSQCGNPNGTAAANAAGAVSYLWDDANNQTTQTATGLGGGTYSVTVTDGSGCTGSAAVTVGSSTPAITASVVSSTQNTSCATPNGSAVVSASGGAAPYVYNWSNGQSGDSLRNVAGGDYFVTITDANLCTGADTISISSTTPVINVSVAAVNSSSCANPDGSATASATGGSGPYTYLWSSGQSGAMITGLTAGTYIVTAADNNQCTGIGNGTVIGPPPLLISITPSPVTSCSVANGSATAAVSGGSGNYSYSWSNGQTGANATGLAAGSHQVTATDATSGCTVSGTAVIGTNTPTVTVNIDSIRNNTNCVNPNGLAVASASGGASPYNYSWSSGQTGPSASGLADGVYNVTAVGQNGCSGTATATVADNTVSFTVTVAVNNPATTCYNGSVSAVTSPSLTSPTYSWSSGAITSVVNNLPGGTYSVTVTNEGCTASGSGTVADNTNPPSVAASATNETSASANDGTATATASGGGGGYAYSWSNGGTSATITGLNAGSYSVTVTDNANCTASASATVQTNSVGIGDLKDVRILSLFPNPATDVVNLQLELNEAKEISVSWHNVLGVKVMETSSIHAKSIEEQYDFATFPQGVYFVRIKVDSEEITRRITLVK